MTFLQNFLQFYHKHLYSHDIQASKFGIKSSVYIIWLQRNWNNKTNKKADKWCFQMSHSKRFALFVTNKQVLNLKLISKYHPDQKQNISQGTKLTSNLTFLSHR